MDVYIDIDNLVSPMAYLIYLSIYQATSTPSDWLTDCLIIRGTEVHLELK